MRLAHLVFSLRAFLHFGNHFFVLPGNQLRSRCNQARSCQSALPPINCWRLYDPGFGTRHFRYSQCPAYGSWMWKVGKSARENREITAVGCCFPIFTAPRPPLRMVTLKKATHSGLSTNEGFMFDMRGKTMSATPSATKWRLGTTQTDYLVDCFLGRTATGKSPIPHCRAGHADNPDPDGLWRMIQPLLLGIASKDARLIFSTYPLPVELTQTAANSASTRDDEAGPWGSHRPSKLRVLEYQSLGATLPMDVISIAAHTRLAATGRKLGNVAIDVDYIGSIDTVQSRGVPFRYVVGDEMMLSAVTLTWIKAIADKDFILSISADERVAVSPIYQQRGQKQHQTVALVEWLDEHTRLREAYIADLGFPVHIVRLARTESTSDAQQARYIATSDLMLSPEAIHDLAMQCHLV